MQLLPAEKSAFAGIAAFVQGSDISYNHICSGAFANVKMLAKDYIPKTLLYWQLVPGPI